MALVKVGDRVGQPPIELLVRLERLVEILLRLLGLAGVVVEQTQLKRLQRLKAVELVEALQRGVGAGEVARRLPRPGEREGSDKAVDAVGGERGGLFQRAGRIAGLEPVDHQDEFGGGGSGIGAATLAASAAASRT